MKKNHWKQSMFREKTVVGRIIFGERCIVEDYIH